MRSDDDDDDVKLTPYPADKLTTLRGGLPDGTAFQATFTQEDVIISGDGLDRLRAAAKLLRHKLWPTKPPTRSS
jgi:hypothetical protein